MSTATASAARVLRNGAVRGVAFVVVTIVVMVICARVSVANPFIGTLIATTAVYALATTGLDFVVGWLREISVGQAASMAVGAYSAAPLLASHPLIAFVAAAIGGAVTGVVVGLPAIRVRGFALATYTLVTGLAIQLLLSDVKAFGGTAGQAILPGSVFGLDLADSTTLVVVSVALLAVGIAVYYLLNHSMVGLAWRAVGLNSPMAGSLSINPVGARLSAFGLAGLFAGVAGLLFALVSGYLAPDMFSFTVSVQLLAMIVIGGRAHPLGGTVGAILFAVYTQYLPASSYSEALLGLILALSVWLAPRGAVLYLGDAGRWLARRLRPTPAVPPERPAVTDAVPTSPAPAGPGPAAAFPATLECAGIGKTYSGVVAVDGVSLGLRPGEITAIVGANGAGKTTLLDLLSGAVPATSGAVRLGERDVTGLAAWRRGRRGLLRCFQDAALFPDFTVRQALFVSAYRQNRYATVSAILRLPYVRRRNAQIRSRVAQVAGQFGLSQWLDTPLRNLSLGMVKIVQLAAVVIAEPQWILLDEPAAGLARAEVDRLAELLRVMSAHLPSSGLLLVEHDAVLVAGAGDRVVVMAEGSVVEDLARNDDGWDDLLRSRRVGTATRVREAVEAVPADAVASAGPVSAGEKLEAQGLTIAYGRFVAVRDVSMEVPRGQLSVLVGTNGAGKSSMLNTIVGLKAPAAGTVTLDGRPLGTSSPHERVRQGLVLVPSGRGLMAALTVAENLRVTKGIRPGDTSLDPLELFPELKRRLRQRAGTLSGGEQQMLALARSVQLNPRYLLIDELSLGLSVTVVERLIVALLAMRDSGVGLLIVEQNAPLALSYSDHAYVMNNGRVAFSGPSQHAAARPDLFRPVFLDPAHS
jgi:branched-chain amino acid transport system ATP-binding protein